MPASSRIARAVEECILTAATTLRPDYRWALERALAGETSDRGRAVLEQLLENARIAEAERVPLCQDTGTVWVAVELGPDERIDGQLQAELDGAVRRAYRAGDLRMSTVVDALLDRANRGDNSPAFVDISFRETPGCTVTVLLKGGGSDNASRVVMLPPAAGFEGVRTAVLEAVVAKAASACPPLVVGVGVGSTFDKVGGLAKHALLREIGSTPSDPRVADLERSLLAEVNATGIGPGGLGGSTTALAVHIETAPSHIAGLPVAVNLGCCALRSCTVEVA